MAKRVSEVHGVAGPLAEDFRSTMRRVAATVTLLSTAWQGERFGMTATSVTSVSFEPPSLLAIVKHTASIHRPLLAAGRFCVNVLFRGQREFCDAFSGQVEAKDRFQIGHWVDNDGIPYLRDAQANVFCAVDRTLPYGTHSIVIGRVLGARSKLEVSPLLYLDGLAQNLPSDLAPNDGSLKPRAASGATGSGAR